MKHFNFLPAFLVGALVLSSCGKPPKAEAPRDFVVPVKLQMFPKGGSIRLVNNKIFMWKADMTVADASAARDISDTIDELDRLAGPVNQQVDVLKDTLNKQKKDRSKASSDLTKTLKSLKDAQTNLATEEAKPDKKAEVIRQLEQQVSSLLTAKLQQAAKIANLDGVVAKTNLDYQAKKTQAETYDKQGKAKVDRLMEVSEYYNIQPASLYFEFRPNGSIRADVSGWGMDTDRDPRDFSTEPTEPGKKPTIGPVTYEELGGVYTFDLYVYEDPAKQDRVRDVFHFRLGRIKLDDEAGRIFFGGEIYRTRTLPNGKTEVRRGMAKCADRFN